MKCVAVRLALTCCDEIDIREDCEVIERACESLDTFIGSGRFEFRAIMALNCVDKGRWIIVFVGSALNLESLEMANAISGLVKTER